MVRVSPCKGCTKRYKLCHSKCKDYSTWRQEVQDYNDMIRKARKAESDVNALTISSRRKRKWK